MESPNAPEAQEGLPITPCPRLVSALRAANLPPEGVDHVLQRAYAMFGAQGVTFAFMRDWVQAAAAGPSWDSRARSLLGESYLHYDCFLPQVFSERLVQI